MVTAMSVCANMSQAQCPAPQQCIVAMLVPADQMQAYYQGAAFSWPSQVNVVPVCDAGGMPMCQVGSCFQMQPQQMQVQAPMTAPLMLQPMQMPSITTGCQVQRVSCGEMDVADVCSQPSTRSSEETRGGGVCSEGEAAKPKLTSSAARRQRRKRAAERQAAQAAAGEAGEDLLERPEGSCLSPEDLEQLRAKLSEGSKQDVQGALSALQGKVWALAQEAAGCRLVQLALDRADQREAAILAQELHGHVCEAATSPHANYVLQKVVSQLSVSTSSFVAEELAGNCAKIVRHRYGCRIFCRLLEFCSSQETTLELVSELLEKVEDLCSHSFGHHVIQSVLEHGKDKHRRRVAAALCADPLAIAKHKNSSYLMEKALHHCSQEDQRALLVHLARPDAIGQLALSQYGSYVARSLLVDQAEKIDLPACLAAIRALSSQLAQTCSGQRLLVELGIALPQGELQR